MSVKKWEDVDSWLCAACGSSDCGYWKGAFVCSLAVPPCLGPVSKCQKRDQESHSGPCGVSKHVDPSLHLTRKAPRLHLTTLLIRPLIAKADMLIWFDERFE